MPGQVNRCSIRGWRQRHMIATNGVTEGPFRSDELKLRLMHTYLRIVCCIKSKDKQPMIEDEHNMQETLVCSLSACRDVLRGFEQSVKPKL